MPDKQANSGPTDLIVFPDLKALKGTAEGGLLLTEKFLSGIAEYRKHWPGTVRSVVKVEDFHSTEMDLAEVVLQEGWLSKRPATEEELTPLLNQAAVVLIGYRPEEVALVHLCNKLGVPVVCVSEYALKTEKQIVDSTTRNPILRARRKFWAHRNHRKRLKLAQDIDAIQCSGTPTYDEYQSIFDNRLLFFDNRVPKNLVVTEEELDARLERVEKHSAPIRLVYGGRFIPMKGVMDLPEIARILVDQDVDFELKIVGTGPLDIKLRSEITRLDVDSQVQVLDPMDFRTGWIPYLKQSADIFVCCHPQGDPSSTYPEVMSCGVPIVGYCNEAFLGVVQHSGSGVVTQMNPHAVADGIRELLKRHELAKQSYKAREFAYLHCFERTFKRRVDHLISSSRLP